MVFDVHAKVALISGGASGLGLAYAKELLRNGAKVSNTVTEYFFKSNIQINIHQIMLRFLKYLR